MVPASKGLPVACDDGLKSDDDDRGARLSLAVTVEELGADAVGRESRVATPPESAPLLERSEGSKSGPESSAGAHRRTPTASTAAISTGFSVGTAKKFCGVQALSGIRLPF